MKTNRILELALEALESQKKAVEAEIASLQAELKGGTVTKSVQSSLTITPPSGRRREKTPAERKAHSEKMKAYWAAKKSEAASKIAKTKPMVKNAPKRPTKA
jgi:hypothetical protein